MPRKSAQHLTPDSSGNYIGYRKVQKGDEWGGFVQHTLSEIDKERFTEWLTSSSDPVGQLLIDVLASGLKVTLVWDSANDCFIGTLTGRPDSKGEMPFTCALSGRGATVQEALGVTLYKHDVVMGSDWTDWLVNGSRTKKSFG